MRELYRYQLKYDGDRNSDDLARRQNTCSNPYGSQTLATCTVYDTQYITVTQPVTVTQPIVTTLTSNCPSLTGSGVFTTTTTVFDKCVTQASSSLSLSDDSRFALAIALPLSLIAGIGATYFI